MVLAASPPRAGFLPAMGGLVDGGPGLACGSAFRVAAALIAFLDVSGLPLLLAGVTGFVASWHDGWLLKDSAAVHVRRSRRTRIDQRDRREHRSLGDMRGLGGWKSAGPVATHLSNLSLRLRAGSMC